MRLKMSRLASPLVPWLLSSANSLFSVLKNDSATALSSGVPGLDTDWAMPCESRHLWKEREVYCAPWSSWKTRLPSSGGSSLPTACPIASIATFSVMRSDIDRPATLREKASIAAAR